MNAPDKIYVREYPDGINQFWDRKKREDVVATIHHEYIRKDALLEWANNALSSRRNMGDDYFIPAIVVLNELIDKLDSM